MSTDRVKWGIIHEMWAGLGLFLVIVLVIIIGYLNGGRQSSLEQEKIRACGHATDVAACIRAVK